MERAQEVLDITVKPGWKDGTRITYGGMGDELPGKPPQVPPCPTLLSWKCFRRATRCRQSPALPFLGGGFEASRLALDSQWVCPAKAPHARLSPWTCFCSNEAVKMSIISYVTL